MEASPRGAAQPRAAPARPAVWRELCPVFVDFEASGPDGWPIEVGWAEIVAGRVAVESHLIRPEPEWDEAKWDEVAADVHGIALDRLRAEGEPAIVVADRVVAALHGRLLVSDAAPYDRAFLRRLFDVRDGDPDWPMTDIAALERSMEPEARARMRSALARLPLPHRAGPDAERLAHAWAAALRTGLTLRRPGHIHRRTASGGW